MTGFDIDADRQGNVVLVVGHARLDPGDERSCVGGVEFKQFSSRVGHLSGGLGHHEGLRGKGEVDAAPGKLACDALVIALRIIAEEGEHESVLSPCRAMAGSRVAA